MTLWTFDLCSVGTARGCPRTVPTLLGAVIKSFWKTTPHHDPPSTKLHTYGVRQVPFFWRPPNQDSSIRLADREVQFVTAESWILQWRFPSYHCVELFTFHFVMYGCSCSCLSIESNIIKLSKAPPLSSSNSHLNLESAVNLSAESCCTLQPCFVRFFFIAVVSISFHFVKALLKVGWKIDCGGYLRLLHRSILLTKAR